MKSCNLTSVYSELERLKEENWRLEKRCSDVSRQLELVTRESHKETEVSDQFQPRNFWILLPLISTTSIKFDILSRRNSVRGRPKVDLTMCYVTLIIVILWLG